MATFVPKPANLPRAGRSAEGERGSFLYTEEGQAIPKDIKNVTIAVSNVPPKAFRGRSTLEIITFTKEVETIGAQSFEKCSNLHRIQFQSSSESKLRTIHAEAFYSCTSLTFVDDLPEGLQEVGAQAFQYCRSLKTVKFPSSLTKLGSDLFRGCSDLQVMEIPSGVKEIPHSAFFSCRKLSSVFLPTALRVIGENAFFSCNALKVIEIPKSVERVGKTSFHDCKALRQSDADGMDLVDLCKNRFKGLPLHRIFYYRRPASSSKVNKVLYHFLSSKYFSRHEKKKAFYDTDALGMTAFDIISDLSSDNLGSQHDVSKWFDSLNSLPRIAMGQDMSDSSLDKLTGLALYASEQDDDAPSMRSSSAESVSSSSIDTDACCSVSKSEYEEYDYHAVDHADPLNTNNHKFVTYEVGDGGDQELWTEISSPEKKKLPDTDEDDENGCVVEDKLDNKDVDEKVETTQENSVVVASTEDETELEETNSINSGSDTDNDTDASTSISPDFYYENNDFVEDNTNTKDIDENLVLTQPNPGLVESIEDGSELQETSKEEENTSETKKKKTTKKIYDRFGNFPLYGKLKTKKQPTTKKVVEDTTSDEDSSSDVVSTDGEESTAMAVLAGEDSMAPYKAETMKAKKAKKSSKKRSKTAKANFDPFGNYAHLRVSSAARRSAFL